MLCPWGAGGAHGAEGMHTCILGWGRLPQAAGLQCMGHGMEGARQGHGVGMQGAAPRGCLCLAAAEFDSWYSPPFSGVTLGSALRMRRPKRRKIPGFMLLLGMLCMSGAELGLGLKSVSGRLKWQGS